MKKLFWLVPALALLTAPGATLAGVSDEEAERAGQPAPESKREWKDRLLK